MASKKSNQRRLISNVPTRIPIPERLLQITDPKQKRDELEAHWLKYGYSDRFYVERIENGHFVMVRKQPVD
ncbi:hypothetical protein [Brevibacillus reuszeri]|uniref:hypothetical protein n=1 Tax=Brevibacillus reuszeri TaxID=54915 RepID=UPI000CCC0A04|nr:hypothetical protein [Brevibacillus reuszeri]